MVDGIIDRETGGTKDRWEVGAANGDRDEIYGD